MTGRRWGVVAIVVATLGLAIDAVVWSESEFRRVEPPIEVTRPGASLDWNGTLNRSYRRLQNDWIWVCASATLGMGGLVLLDGRWRRPWPSGTIVVLVALTVGTVSAAHFFLGAPAMFKTNGLCYGLRDALEFRMPGAILGALAVTWGRKVDWRGWLIAGLWMANVAMLIAYGLIFG